MDLEDVKLDCSKCDSDQFKFWGKEYTGVSMAKCRKCGLRLVHPRMNIDQLQEEVYGDHYKFETGLTFSAQRSVANKLRYDQLSLLKVVEFNKVENPSTLDVGFGQGGFLEMAQISGFKNLTASDINDSKKDITDELNIPLIVDDITQTEMGTYDIVNAQHVLEHVPDPFEFMKAIKRCLKPGGIAHIVVPNEGGLVSRQKSFLSRIGLKKKAFKHLSPWHHLFFFEKESLKNVAEDVGFELEYIGTRNNIKQKGLAYEAIHHLFNKLMLNTHLEVVLRVK